MLVKRRRVVGKESVPYAQGEAFRAFKLAIFGDLSIWFNLKIMGGASDGYSLDFPFENYERMADFMRRCKGRVMVSINDHPDIRCVFEEFHFETLDIRYTTTNQREGKASITGELVIMNWVPESLGELFRCGFYLYRALGVGVRVSMPLIEYGVGYG